MATGYVNGALVVDLPDSTPATLTPQEVQAIVTATVQRHLDSHAQSRGYDSILSACSYDGDPDPVFSAEGIAFKSWRSAVWRYCYGVLADINASLRPIPTPSELIAELPAAPAF